MSARSECIEIVQYPVYTVQCTSIHAHCKIAQKPCPCILTWLILSINILIQQNEDRHRYMYNERAVQQLVFQE